MKLVPTLLALGVSIFTFYNTAMAQNSAEGNEISTNHVTALDSIVNKVCGGNNISYTNQDMAPNGNRVAYFKKDNTVVVVASKTLEKYFISNGGKVTSMETFQRPESSKSPFYGYVDPISADNIVSHIGLEINVPKTEQENVTAEFCKLIGVAYNPIK